MSKVAPPSLKKRKLEDGMKGKISRPQKRTRKQRQYHSSSEEEDEISSGFAPVNLDDSEEEAAPKKTSVSNHKQRQLPPQKQNSKPSIESNDSEDDSDVTGDGYDGETSDSDAAGEDSTRRRKVSKRNDPEAFSTSMSKILSTKLPQSARKDPVLSRSREAAEVTINLANERLELRAKAKLRADKKEDLQRGRVKDVLGLSTGQAGEVAEEEKRLRKVAQRGVIKLFNAVRAAQVRGEQAAREERKKGTIGQANREEKINEISKQGFLELISGKKIDSTKEI